MNDEEQAERIADLETGIAILRSQIYERTNELAAAERELVTLRATGRRYTYKPAPFRPFFVPGERG